MKRLLVVLLSVFCACVYGAVEWNAVNVNGLVFKRVDINGNGNVIVATATDGVYVSEDGGAVWAKRLSGKSYVGVVVNNDGNKISVASSNWLDMYVTEDRGITWNVTRPTGNVDWWSSVCRSEDGNILIATSGGDKLNQVSRVYLSYDWGKTWQINYVDPANWSYRGACVSNDGSKYYMAVMMDGMVGIENGVMTRYSPNYSMTGGRDFWTVKMSGDSVYAIGFSDGVTNKYSNGVWSVLTNVIGHSLAVDDNVIVIGTCGGGVVYSEDWGNVWETAFPATVTANYESAAISTDGNRIVMAPHTGGLVIGNITKEVAKVKIEFVADDGGYVSGNVAQEVPVGGETEPVEAIPDNGYKFVSWAEDQSVSRSRSFGKKNELINPLIISNVNDSKRYIATFVKEQAKFTVKFMVNGNGTLAGGDVTQEVIEGGNADNMGAYAKTGYQFVGWTGSVTSVENPLVIENVNCDMEIYANFEEESDGIYGGKEGIAIVLKESNKARKYGDYNRDTMVMTFANMPLNTLRYNARVRDLTLEVDGVKFELKGKYVYRGSRTTWLYECKGGLLIYNTIVKKWGFAFNGEGDYRALIDNADGVTIKVKQGDRVLCKKTYILEKKVAGRTTHYFKVK